jgi:hypothetical protein
VFLATIVGRAVEGTRTQIERPRSRSRCHPRSVMPMQAAWAGAGESPRTRPSTRRWAVAST